MALSDLSSPTAVKKAIAECERLGRIDIVGMSHSEGWSLHECEIAVRAYLGCLKDQADGKPINKAQVYRSTAGQLNNRSTKSVEYKFQNIEKILEEEDLPRLGMSTKANYQNLLRTVVLDLVEQAPEDISRPPKSLPPQKNWDNLVVSPPSAKKAGQHGAESTGARARASVAAHDAANKVPSGNWFAPSR